MRYKPLAVLARLATDVPRGYYLLFLIGRLSSGCQVTKVNSPRFAQERSSPAAGGQTNASALHKY